MATIEEIEKVRADRKAALEAERQAQFARDLEALNDAEVAHGDGAIVRVNLGRYISGLPTMVLARLPKPVEYKRYQDRVIAGVNGITAGNELADVCVVYPDKEAYPKVREAFTGIHVNVSVAIRKACEGRAAEEGKD